MYPSAADRKAVCYTRLMEEDIATLKKEGHRYIDLLVDLGFSRRRVYERLRIRLKTNYGEHHFSRLNTIPELKRAVKFLRKWYNYEHDRISNDVCLPQSEINRLVKKS